MEEEMIFDLNETERDYQVALEENWQGIAGETAMRLLEQIPVLVAELRQARGEITTLMEYGKGLVDALHQAEAEVKRLRALVPPPKLLRRLAEWANEAVLDGGDCLGEDMGTEEYPNTDDVKQAQTLARRIEEAQAIDIVDIVEICGDEVSNADDG